MEQRLFFMIYLIVGTGFVINSSDYLIANRGIAFGIAHIGKAEIAVVSNSCFIQYAFSAVQLAAIDQKKVCLLEHIDCRLYACGCCSKAVHLADFIVAQFAGNKVAHLPQIAGSRAGNDDILAAAAMAWLRIALFHDI